MQHDMEVLSRYVPDRWTHVPLKHIYGSILNDDHIHRGKLPSRKETVYVDTHEHVSDLNLTHAGIAIHDVINTINWHDIPIEYEALHPPTSQYDADERPHVRWYSRIRNAITHAELLEVGRDPEPAIADELDRLRGPPNGSSHQDVLNTLAELDIAPTIRDDTHLVYDTAEKSLREKARAEGLRAASKWEERQEDALAHTVMRDEVMYVTETTQRTYVGGQTDRICHLHDYDAPGVIEIKVTHTIHPRHKLQVETARRAFSEMLGEECVGVILRITPTGEYEILTSKDKEWPTDVCWDWVCRRSEIVYHELEPHLTTAERRLL